jgi:uncharacterized membrane protein YkgB
MRAKPDGGCFVNRAQRNTPITEHSRLSLVIATWLGCKYGVASSTREVENAEPLVTASPLTARLREKLGGPGGIRQLSVLGESLLKDTVFLGAALLTAAESLRAAHAGNRS